MFMRVNSRCAHQARPPLRRVLMDQTVPAVVKHYATSRYVSFGRYDHRQRALAG
jgi:hypothetical protein